jgi:hypothetical protein
MSAALNAVSGTRQSSSSMSLRRHSKCRQLVCCKLGNSRRGSLRPSGLGPERAKIGAPSEPPVPSSKIVIARRASSAFDARPFGLLSAGNRAKCWALLWPANRLPPSKSITRPKPAGLVALLMRVNEIRDPTRKADLVALVEQLGRSRKPFGRAGEWCRVAGIRSQTRAS